MAQENKHTPSPWGFSDDPRSEMFYRADREGNFISKLPRTKANMRLMVAAPDMLEEMENLAKALEDTGHEPPQSFYNVIKKARGNQL